MYDSSLTAGLRPTGFFGAFFMANTTDIELGNIDAEKAIAVEIKHDDKLKENDTVLFQVYICMYMYVHRCLVLCILLIPQLFLSTFFFAIFATGGKNAK